MLNQEDYITVVSGLPRSGTSMMMRMLEQGGIPLLTDNYRKADGDNPLGYYEFEAVKKLDQNASWLAEAVNKAVKIIYVFLYRLPSNYRYRVLFLKRNLEDVVASQKLMLRHRQEADRMTDQQLMNAFTAQLKQLNAWLAGQPHLAVHYLQYEEVVAEPGRAAEDIRSFLGRNLDVDAMIRSVDPKLHRNRSIAV
jgi:hypothetical protein